MSNDKLIFLSFLSALVFSSCKEDGNDLLSGATNNQCTLPTGSLSWKVESNTYCANASLFADHTILMTINGISQTGITMTLELDSVHPGTFPMTADNNSLLFTDQLAMAWQTTNDNPGTLIITSNDTANNILQGSFTANIRNPLGITKSLSQGKIKVFYTE